MNFQKATIFLITLLTIFSVSLSACAKTNAPQHKVTRTPSSVSTDTVKHSEPSKIQRLTEKDYSDVAKKLGVETAAIKAVVEIEAGPGHMGFFKPGMPLINFDMSMFRTYAGRNGINLSKYYKSHAVVFSRPNSRKYGSTQAGQHERLKAARTIHPVSAIQGCFWGMFQIGGFNWKKCGCSSIDEFVTRMSHSEREQLEMFAEFVKNAGLLPHLKAKNWAAFARGYNGPSYASRGYHTRLANAYAKYKK